MYVCIVSSCVVSSISIVISITTITIIISIIIIITVTIISVIIVSIMLCVVCNVMLFIVVVFVVIMLACCYRLLCFMRIVVFVCCRYRSIIICCYSLLCFRKLPLPGQRRRGRHGRHRLRNHRARLRHGHGALDDDLLVELPGAAHDAQRRHGAGLHVDALARERVDDEAVPGPVEDLQAVHALLILVRREPGRAAAHRVEVPEDLVAVLRSLVLGRPRPRLRVGAHHHEAVAPEVVLLGGVQDLHRCIIDSNQIPNHAI